MSDEGPDNVVTLPIETYQFPVAGGIGPGRPHDNAILALRSAIERACANGASGVAIVLSYPGGGTSAIHSTADLNAENALMAGMLALVHQISAVTNADSQFSRSDEPDGAG